MRSLIFLCLCSYTFSNIQANSEKVWRYYRYSLIYEYFDKPTLPPPFNLLTHVWRFGRLLFRELCHIHHERSNNLCNYALVYQCLRAQTSIQPRNLNVKRHLRKRRQKFQLCGKRCEQMTTTINHRINRSCLYRYTTKNAKHLL